MKKEDIDFLKELQHELKTQTNDGNAQPLYWGVMEKKERAMPDGCGYPLIYNGDDTQSLEEKVSELVDEYEGWNNEIQEEWSLVDKTDIESVVDFCNEYLDCSYSIVWADEVEEISHNTGAFLTKRACQEYIDKFGYNHCKPHTYAMTAYRNFELERLLNILTNMDINDIKDDIDLTKDNVVFEEFDFPDKDIKIVIFYGGFGRKNNGNIEQHVKKYVGDKNYFCFIDHHLDNHWIQVIVLGLDNDKFSEMEKYEDCKELVLDYDLKILCGGWKAEYANDYMDNVVRNEYINGGNTYVESSFKFPYLRLIMSRDYIHIVDAKYKSSGY